MSKLISVSLDHFLIELANENIKLVSALTPSEAKPKIREALTKFLAKYIELVVVSTLNEKPSGDNPTKDEMYKFAHKNYSSIKYSIQNDVAEGLSKALSKFAGKPVDYYCQLLPVPKPMNKEPC